MVEEEEEGEGRSRASWRVGTWHSRNSPSFGDQEASKGRSKDSRHCHSPNTHQDTGETKK